ncbi:MAG: hypothetical protein P8Y99_05730 [Calditrichaceae bacterium]
MKRTIKSILILFALTSIVFAQGKYTEFKVGLLGPKDAETGFFGGLTFGRSVDQNLGIALAIDVYKKSYNKEERVDNKDLNIPNLPATDVT